MKYAFALVWTYLWCPSRHSFQTAVKPFTISPKHKSAAVMTNHSLMRVTVFGVQSELSQHLMWVAASSVKYFPYPDVSWKCEFSSPSQPHTDAFAYQPFSSALRWVTHQKTELTGNRDLCVVIPAVMLMAVYFYSAFFTVLPSTYVHSVTRGHHKLQPALYGHIAVHSLCIPACMLCNSSILTNWLICWDGELWCVFERHTSVACDAVISKPFTVGCHLPSC